MKKNTPSSRRESLLESIDWISTLVPLFVILFLSLIFILSPQRSTQVLDTIRGFLGHQLGAYYVILGVAFLAGSLYIAFSEYGTIRLGAGERPEYSSFQWGTMIFTSTMAADILFYSLCEWALYANESYVQSQGSISLWAPTYALFHWGPIAWSFYTILAASFGFMLHVRGKNKQKFSEACRPLLGDKVDGLPGKLIDLFSIFALLAGTATTFSVATPLLSASISKITGLASGSLLTIGVMLFVALVYSLAVWFGMKGISLLATWCTYAFILLLAYVFFGGKEGVFILETGIASLGNMLQNFVALATWTDPLRETGFTQNWTIFYWAYWMVWCVATPFFIGSISKGRSVKNVILGTYGWGLAGTFTSFIILGNYGLAQQIKQGLDVSGLIVRTGEISQAIVEVLSTLPFPRFGLFLLSLTMVAFYATTFDALTMVISFYSYKKLRVGQEPDKIVRSFWAAMFILLPIGLIYAHNSMNSLQSVSIFAAFPMGIIILLITFSFLKDARLYLGELAKKNQA